MSPTTKPPARFADLPRNYEALCRLHVPRTIHDDAELEAVTVFIDLMAGHELTADQSDYLDTLSTLAAEYEERHAPELPRLAAHEFLAAHLENIGMSASQWGERIGIDRSTASRLLRGERRLNTDHIRRTAEQLQIAPELLIGI